MDEQPEKEYKVLEQEQVTPTITPDQKPVEVTQTITQTSTITLGQLQQQRDSYQSQLDRVDDEIAEVKTALGIKG